MKHMVNIKKIEQVPDLEKEIKKIIPVWYNRIYKTHKDDWIERYGDELWSSCHCIVGEAWGYRSIAQKEGHFSGKLPITMYDDCKICNKLGTKALVFSKKYKTGHFINRWLLVFFEHWFKAKHVKLT